MSEKILKQVFVMDNPVYDFVEINNSMIRIRETENHYHFIDLFNTAFPMFIKVMDEIHKDYMLSIN